MRFRTKNTRLRLYCRKADDIHEFIPIGEYVLCTVDGHKMLAANVVVQYATDEDYIMMPQDEDE